MTIEHYPDARLVFADIDNIIYPGNLGMDAARQVAEGFKALKTLARVGTAVVRFRRGKGSILDVVAAACGLFAGEAEGPLTAKVQEATRRELLPRMIPATLSALRRYDGTPLVLFSAAPQAVVDVFVEALGAYAGYGARVEVRDGLLTDEPVEPIPYAEGKVALATGAAEALGVALTDAVYFGDSSSDAHLLGQVGYPVCINASAGLRAAAAEAGWPVLSVSP